MGGWRLRTFGMFIFMTLLLMVIGGIVSLFVQGNRWIYYIEGAMFAVSILICVISYFKSKQMALRANHAKIITEKENPRLYKIVREVAEKAGVPMPEVGICNTPIPNAFATGRNPENAAVVATTGILNLLPDDELRGVIAHEMSHVRNRDILVMSIASAMAITISYAARILFYTVLFDRRNNDNGAMIAIALAAQILVPIAAMLIQLGISRNREYLADATGAEIIQDPRALAKALAHLEKGAEMTVTSYELKDPDAKSTTASIMSNQSYAHMWIANPLKKASFMSLFSTHPPMEERIARLNKMAEQMKK